MIRSLFENFARVPLGVIGSATQKTLEFTRDTVANTLDWSGEGLEFLARHVSFWEEARLGLTETGKHLRESSSAHRENLESAISDTVRTFRDAFQQIHDWEKSTDQLITQNRVLSSILGSSKDGALKLSKIEMSLRLDGADISPDDFARLFRGSQAKEIILFLPGLFTDEDLWIHKRVRMHKRTVVSRGLGDFLVGRGYYPGYIRYNHGLHISENGEKLAELISKLQIALPATQIHILAYSLGCLVSRSMFYHSKQVLQKPLKLGKIIHIASPDRGSYLEKLGFWVAFLLEKAPVSALRIIGKIGNYRSDAIKDLSHGIIRKQDWEKASDFFQKEKEYYYGELDGEDFYQAYSYLSLPHRMELSWLGDGIVEMDSLRYLTERVSRTLPEPETRVLEVPGANHFTILNSGKLFRWLGVRFPHSEVAL